MTKCFHILIFSSVIICIYSCSSHKTTLFQQVESSRTGIHFNNEIVEKDSMNPLTYINIYNGGGVGTGDFNNDGLQDIYFTGNMVSNKLYLNKGDLSFEDVTEQSKVDGLGRWSRGVSVIDINNDGKMDIHVATSMRREAKDRKNILYVNQGNNADGVPVFKDMAAEYGLDDTTHTTMGLFFDYDNDGDLDLYIVVNESVLTENPSKFRPILANGSHPSTGRLYRNDWNEQLGHGVFVNVSKEAGILTEGYGHGGAITDINRDGWKDIYVTNDFVSNNILYINNHDGTFTDRSKEYFKHTSTFAMGVDVQDLNNDGLLDIVELDMNPQDNFRKKMMLGANSYQTYQNFDNYHYQYQYSRNTLQINQGNAVKQNDSMGIPVFSEMSYLSGISETDWSWTPMVTDFDNDGFRDIVITNGYPKDVTDHDFMIFRSKAANIATPQEILGQVPQVRLHNYAYKNNGDLSFADVSAQWGLTVEDFSSGAAYADLDNDGDLDMIVNNTNGEASVYKNTAVVKETSSNNYLNIKFTGSKQNINGFGAWAEIYYDNGKHQVYEHSPYRGYLSSIQDMAHFGIGKSTRIDSVVITWQDLKKQVLKNVEPNQLLTVSISNADLLYAYPNAMFASKALFSEITASAGIDFTYSEPEYVDFNVQKLLPHKFSEYSPALAVADVDGNGLEDIVCGGTSVQSAGLFLQQPNGKFLRKNLFNTSSQEKPGDGSLRYGTDVYYSKDAGILLFDADGDNDQDLYIASGGYENQPNAKAYGDKFYVNDGNGNFTRDTTAFPENFTSKFCVRAVDYDKDGDLDIFIAGRVDPWNYPRPVSSILLRNDSQKGKPKFTDVTKTVAKDLVDIGLVCDAVFTDFDNDGWQDLVLAGEWMPITFLKNDKGVFKSTGTSSGISQETGWWNTIAPGDFDNDGDIDYIVGNLGKNSFYKGNDKYPVYITGKDFDSNGSYDAFPSIFLQTSHQDTTRREYPVNQRDDAVKQLISLRIKFQNYGTYARATMDSLFSAEQMKDALRLKATMFASCYIRNDGNGKFTLSELPVQAQVSVLNGIVVDDFDGDGNLDVVINGNDFGTEVSVGRYDALNGLMMKGDGKGNFKALTIEQSGIYLPGNGKAFVQLTGKNGNKMLAASQHSGPLQLFELKRHVRNIPVMPMDVSATVKYKNGVSQKREIYYGYSFLSQSGRFITVDENVVSLSITDNKGTARDVPLN